MSVLEFHTAITLLVGVLFVSIDTWSNHGWNLDSMENQVWIFLSLKSEERGDSNKIFEVLILQSLISLQLHKWFLSSYIRPEKQISNQLRRLPDATTDNTPTKQTWPQWQLFLMGWRRQWQPFHLEWRTVRKSPGSWPIPWKVLQSWYGTRSNMLFGTLLFWWNKLFFDWRERWWVMVGIRHCWCYSACSRDSLLLFDLYSL